MDGMLTVDSATRLGPDALEKVVVCGSHGGLYPAWLAARAGVRALVLNDAGIGRYQAGIAGVIWLDSLGIAACAIDHRSARIGDAADALAGGVITMANDVAARHGCLPGHTCRQVVKCLIENCEPASREEVPPIGETRARIGNTGHREVWALDSVALAEAGDRPKIVVTGPPRRPPGRGPRNGASPLYLFPAFFYAPRRGPGAPGANVHPLAGEFLRHGRILQRFGKLLVHTIHQRGRRARGCNHAPPRERRESGHALLGYGCDTGKLRRWLFGGDRERFHATT